MTATLRMEWLRLRSVRSTYWLLTVAALATIGVGVTVLVVYRTHLPRPASAQMVNDGLAGVALGQLFVGFLGVLSMTGEYSSGMIRATLAAVPDRKRVLAAKAAVFGVVAFVIGEAVTFATFFASQAALNGSPVPRATLGDPGVLRTVLFSGVYLALIGLLGMGLGAVLRHTGAAVGVLFGLLFVPPFVLGILGHAGFQVAKFTPLIILANSVGVVTPTQGCLSAWAGLGVIALYAAVALGLGGWLLTRRDA
jgi:ABC-type transport system involved in multi-copper enzyme maturation permease subunit